jgi:hypothetical protein
MRDNGIIYNTYGGGQYVVNREDGDLALEDSGINWVIVPAAPLPEAAPEPEVVPLPEAAPEPEVAPESEDEDVPVNRAAALIEEALNAKAAAVAEPEEEEDEVPDV